MGRGGLWEEVTLSRSPYPDTDHSLPRLPCCPGVLGTHTCPALCGSLNVQAVFQCVLLPVKPGASTISVFSSLLPLALGGNSSYLQGPSTRDRMGATLPCPGVAGGSGWTLICIKSLLWDSW